MLKVNIEDWVVYHCSRNDSVEFGFVLNKNEDYALINNTSRDGIVRKIHIDNIIKKMDILYDKLHKEELNLLVDLAIQTNDKEWLKELSEKLNVK